jgi:hypothetical protein
VPKVPNDRVALIQPLSTNLREVKERRADVLIHPSLLGMNDVTDTVVMEDCRHAAEQSTGTELALDYSTRVAEIEQGLNVRFCTVRAALKIGNPDGPSIGQLCQSMGLLNPI